MANHTQYLTFWWGRIRAFQDVQRLGERKKENYLISPTKPFIYDQPEYERLSFFH